MGVLPFAVWVINSRDVRWERDAIRRWTTRTIAPFELLARME
jgi:hypothetical protein